MRSVSRSGRSLPIIPIVANPSLTRSKSLCPSLLVASADACWHSTPWKCAACSAISPRPSWRSSAPEAGGEFAPPVPVGLSRPIARSDPATAMVRPSSRRHAAVRGRRTASSVPERCPSASREAMLGESTGHPFGHSVDAPADHAGRRGRRSTPSGRLRRSSRRLLDLSPRRSPSRAIAAAPPAFALARTVAARSADVRRRPRPATRRRRTRP